MRFGHKRAAPSREWFSPPREVVNNTKERRAWLASKKAELEAAGREDVRVVGKNCYEQVSCKVAKEKKTVSQIVGLCQICGREHGSINGQGKWVAHHGYQRPGDGWQTPSCSGAKEPFLEESCECAEETARSLLNSAEMWKKTIDNPDSVKSVYVKVRMKWNEQPTSVTVTPENAEQYDKRGPWERTSRDGGLSAWSFFLRTYLHGLTQQRKAYIEMADELLARVAAWKKGKFAGTTKTVQVEV